MWTSFTSNIVENKFILAAKMEKNEKKMPFLLIGQNQANREVMKITYKTLLFKFYKIS